MSTTHPPIAEAFVHLMDLYTALGHPSPVKSAFPTLWEHQIDARWTIALNGTDRTQTTRSIVTGVPIEPYHVAVFFNGWPVGIFSPAGGIIAAGEAANEETFIEAVKAAIERARAAPRT